MNHYRIFKRPIYEYTDRYVFRRDAFTVSGMLGTNFTKSPDNSIFFKLFTQTLGEYSI